MKKYIYRIYITIIHILCYTRNATKEVMAMKKRKVSDEDSPIVSDPFGSYTGCGLDPNEKPVQDADDL